jgi:hypothetical protein
MQLVLKNPYRTVGLLVGASAREHARQYKAKTILGCGSGT